MLREDRKRNTKERIVRTAIQLFKEKGYANVTVEEITRLCGIAKGTFFNYFPKKENVLLHVGNSYTELLSGIVHKPREGNLRDRVMAIFRDFLSLYLKHADILRLVLIESIQSATGSADEPTNLAVFQEAIRDLLEEAKNEGALRSRFDSGVCASVLVAIFYQTLISGSASADEAAMAAILQEQFDAAWEGISDE
ncbi:TetR/AcrR family transcriptional regulator [Cohnella thailandensis]|uniref:TetR/AcrR family transcriptional regulator n=1 Tax=Cohnella thailandensis TaxID=557557 RepID=A0A841T6P0_9BACL|nr:TetR/AcrR family transcriptional regulator [Cohnella thailandensis]MBB6636821.1 TetR/AcrR family transcriptional regulator [Cohnella thailandensis]MBP1973302.1 AcrR family transcriptional regulator [Cohnella thailandensis]